MRYKWRVTSVFRSRLVYGGHTWHPAFDPVRSPTEEACLELLRTAHEEGIRHLDATYEAEVEVLGHLLRRSAGLDSGVGCLQFFGIVRTPAEQRAQLLRWMERLGRSILDHLYVFPPPDADQVAELRRQREEGLVRALGLWLREFDEAVDADLFDFVAAVYNPARPELAPRLEALHSSGLGVLVLEPLGGGALLAGLPPSERGLLAEALLEHALSRPWCDSVDITMRTRNEVAANARVARSVATGAPDREVPRNLRYGEGADPWVRGKALDRWDGRFGSGGG